jgi:hypothetical protein
MSKFCFSFRSRTDTGVLVESERCYTLTMALAYLVRRCIRAHGVEQTRMMMAEAIVNSSLPYQPEQEPVDEQAL